MGSIRARPARPLHTIRQKASEEPAKAATAVSTVEDFILKVRLKRCDDRVKIAENARAETAKIQG